MSKLTIPVNELLWRTRGKHWEYCFLILPQVDRGSWWRFYREVRAELNISPEGDEVIGTLIDREGNQRPYLASVFLDAKLSDAAGRETEQFVVWFPESLDEADLPANLARTVSEHFSKAISSTKMTELTDDSEESPETHFRHFYTEKDEIQAARKTPDSPAPRKLDLTHQTDADLTLTQPQKKRRILKPALVIIGSLVAALLILHFTDLISLPFLPR